jgi:large subunit ribosomal protein L22
MATVSPERETVKAQARYVRTSARKARLVLEHIRGKSAVQARDILAFHTRAAARDAGKVLASAIANAENNNGHDVEDLIVAAAYADEGPTLKRWRPRARGRVNRIEKRTCHITITLAVAEPGEIKQRRTRVVTTPAPAAPTPPPEVEEAPVEEAAADEAAVVEEAPKPKRKPRAKKPKATPEAEAAPEAEAVADAEPAAEPDPVAAAEPETETEPEPTPEAEVEAEDQPSETKDDEEASS